MEKVSLKFNLPVSFIKEGKSYIAYTPALDLSTCADTYEKAKDRFEEIVNIFFEEIKEKGTLEDVLLGLGWVRAESGWNPPVIISQELKETEVLAK